MRVIGVQSAHQTMPGRSVAARELHAFPTPVVHALWFVAHVRTLADNKHRTRPVQNSDTEPCLLTRKTRREYPAVKTGFHDLNCLEYMHVTRLAPPPPSPVRETRCWQVLPICKLDRIWQRRRRWPGRTRLDAASMM